MSDNFRPRGLYFEEFTLGHSVTSAGRTITETDVVNFAGISGDYAQIHTDAEYARQAPFGQRVAHGLLCLSIASGLLMQLGLLEGTVLAFRELTWKFSLPVFIGDTLRAHATVTEMKAYPRLKGGILTLEIDLINQQDKVVHTGRWVALVASKPDQN